MIKVFGHISPDTDATVAPLAYAWLLNQKGDSAEAFVLGELNKETTFVLKTAGVKTPETLTKLTEGDEVIIIDTNNPDELPEGIDKANIKAIIDHHKLAGLTTNKPLDIYMRPLGSSSTLVYQLISDDNITPEKSIAILLLSGILSDTLNLTSPTTTDEDHEAATELQKIADVDINDHANKMFEAKSDLSGMSPKDLILADSKVMEFPKGKVRISVLESTNPDNAKKMITELTKALDEQKSEENLTAAFLFIIDILNQNADGISSPGDDNILETAFNKKFENNFINLPAVVSRKKQIAPAIEKTLS